MFRTQSRRPLSGFGFRGKKDDRVVLHQILFFLLILLLPAQLGWHWWPQWSYVWGIRVDYLSPTIYLTDILVFGVLGLWVLEILKEKRRSFSVVILNLIQNLYRSRIKCGMTFFFPISIFFFLLANCFFAQSQPVAFYRLIKLVEFFLLALYVANIPITNYQLPITLSVVYSSLIALAQFIKQSSLNGPFYWLGERTFSLSTPGIAKAVVGGRLILRPYATFPHPNVLAGFILVSLILIFPITNYKLLITKVFRRLVFALGVVAILISFSRSAWLVGLMVGLWLGFRTPPGWVKTLLRDGGKRRGFFLITIYSLLITFFVLLLFFRLPFSTDEAVVQRLELAKISLAMIKERPLVGVGLGNFIVRLPDFWQGTGTIRFLQPVHNIFLLVAAETGLVGLVAFLWFLILTYKKLLISNYYLLITVLSAILLLGLFDHYWLTLQQPQLLFAVVLGLSWGIKKNII